MKVVTGKEMVKIEQQSYQIEGQQLAQVYMEKAGVGVAEFVDVYLKEKRQQKKRQQINILLLCAKGNNSGDAYVCGRVLCGMGYGVRALQITPIQEASVLCQLNYKKFIKSGGVCVSSLLDGLSQSELLIDGLLGTGFVGLVKDSYANVIKQVNAAKKKVIAIDIPSGLNAAEGAVGLKGHIIKADVTLYLELPKVGFFLEEGMNYIGKLAQVSFGLKKKYIDHIQTSFKLLTKEKCKLYLPSYHRTRHKYQAGFLTVIAGSANMTGAAFLTTLAAFRSGSGMVKLLCTKETSKALSYVYPELVKVIFDDSQSVTEISEQLLKSINVSSACVIGPGIGLEEKTRQLITQLIPKIHVPVLIDADALTMFGQKSFSLPKFVIMTPHLGELARVLKLKRVPKVTKELLDKICLFSSSKKVVMVVKGAPTFVVLPNGSIYVCPIGDAGMATAGSGDVLSGIIGSFLTQRLSCKEASLLGVCLHGEAGVLAAEKKTSFSLMASDIIDYISVAIQKLDQS